MWKLLATTVMTIVLVAGLACGAGEEPSAPAAPAPAAPAVSAPAASSRSSRSDRATCRTSACRACRRRCGARGRATRTNSEARSSAYARTGSEG